MNRNIIQVVLSQTNNQRLFQILNLKKLNEHDYLLPKIIKFKKYSKSIHPMYEYDDIEEIIWINKFTFYDKIFSYIFILEFPIKNGRFDIIYFLYKNRNDIFLGDTISWAAEYGQLDIIKFFYNEQKKNKDLKFETNEWPIGNAVEYNQYNVFKWLFNKVFNKDYIYNVSNDSNDHLQTFMDTLAIHGRLKFIKYVFKKIKNINRRIDVMESMNYAVDQGYLHIIKWYYKKMPEKFKSNILIKKTLKTAIENDHLNIIKWLFMIEIFIPLLSKNIDFLISYAKKYKCDKIVAFLQEQKIKN